MGLIHRDVKPGNILLDSRERAYLTDFGLIRRTQLHTDLTKTGQFMGTIDYCAPEQIKGGEIDGRADVYSLGCVLFECLTGAPPFRKDTEVATIYAHLEEDAEGELQAPRISPLLSSVVTKAMAKRPEDRFAAAGEMAEALRGQPAMHEPHAGASASRRSRLRRSSRSRLSRIQRSAATIAARPNPRTRRASPPPCPRAPWRTSTPDRSDPLEDGRRTDLAHLLPTCRMGRRKRLGAVCPEPRRSILATALRKPSSQLEAVGSSRSIRWR